MAPYHHALHPQLHPHHFTHPENASTPYSVLKERIELNGTAGTNDNIVLIGPAGNDTIISSSIARRCAVAGTAIPSFTPTLSSVLPTTFSRARISRLSVSLSCTGTTGGVVPYGMAKFGTLKEPIDYAQFTTESALAAFLNTRPELVSKSMYSLMERPVECVSTMLDYVDALKFKYPSYDVAYQDLVSDMFAPVVLFVPGSSGTAQGAFWLSITIEWNIIYTSGADPVLASTHRLHTPKPITWWQSLGKAAQEASGIIDTTIRAVRTVGGAIEGAARVAGAIRYPARNPQAPAIMVDVARPPRAAGARRRARFSRTKTRAAPVLLAARPRSRRTVGSRRPARRW